MPTETAPAAPVVPPAAALPPVMPVDSGGVPQDHLDKPVTRPEDDPNHHMNVLVGKARDRKQAEKDKPVEKQAEKPPEKSEDKPSEDKTKLNELIAGALKFTPKKQEKPDDKAKKTEEKPAEVPKDDKGSDKVVGDDTSAGKTIVKPKKTVEAPSINLERAASEAATAAVRAMQPMLQAQTVQTPVSKPEENLKEDDRQEYIVAKFLSDNNPKFKGAEKVVLEHIKKSEDYAARWESENPGKLFDPNDETHDDFYSSLKKPWSDRDFRDAEIEMKAEQIVERKMKGSQAKMDRLEQEGARIEMAPVVERKFTSAAAELAKAVGTDVHEKIVKHGFSKLEQEDPITAAVLSETLGPLQPIIETIIQIDDPKGRFAIDPKNPLHQQWSEILVEGEKLCVGRKDEQDRMFCSRSDYAKMNSTQRNKYWYLTPDHLIAGVVDYAAKNAATIIKNEKEKMKKMAESMGYVLKPAGDSKSDATNTSGKQGSEKQADTVSKPVSPSVGSGAKIDDKADKPKTGNALLMDSMSKILFSKS